jgi:hypothetical protein
MLLASILSGCGESKQIEVLTVPEVVKPRPSRADLTCKDEEMVPPAGSMRVDTDGWRLGEGWRLAGADCRGKLRAQYRLNYPEDFQ